MTSPSPRMIGVPGSVLAVTPADDVWGASCAEATPSGVAGIPSPLPSAAPHASQNLPDPVVTDPHDGQFTSGQILPCALNLQHCGSADPLHVGLDYGTILNCVSSLICSHGAVGVAGRQPRGDHVSVNGEDGQRIGSGGFQTISEGGI